jgi:hypothetical protein
MEAQDFVSKIHPREKADRAEVGKKADGVSKMRRRDFEVK